MSSPGSTDRPVAKPPVRKVLLLWFASAAVLVTLASLLVTGTWAYVIWFRAEPVVVAGKVVETFNGDGSYLVEFTSPDGTAEMAAVIKPDVPQRRIGDHVLVSYLPPLTDIATDEDEISVANSPVLIAGPILGMFAGLGGLYYVRRLLQQPGRERLEVP
jgi:hypothetical protein